MNDLATIFKANDIRGIYGEALTDAVFFRVGRALAAEMPRGGKIAKIALGRDGRLSSESLAKHLAAGLCDGGARVLDIGLVPTPALYYAAACRADGNGVMVTGSHNPKSYNGAKMLLNGETLKGERLRNLFCRVRDEDFPDATAGAVEKIAVKEKYIGEVAAANPLCRPLRVLVDAGNGAAGEYAPELYRKMGCEVKELFCDIDGNFPNHHPDPAQPENLRDAAECLAGGGHDVALLFDGDGDRLGVLLPGHPPIFADRLLMLYARDMLARNAGGRVVFDVKCSALLPPWVEQHGGIPDMQPTGHAFIKARMREKKALLGGEMSGHFYFRENWYGFDDALFAGARLLALLATAPDALADIPDSVSSPELQVDMTGKNQHQFVKKLRESAKFPAAESVVTIDGIRAEYTDGFGLVRASNTTPALVLRFEAKDEAGLTRIKEEFRRILLTADKSLKLPF